MWQIAGKLLFLSSKYAGGICCYWLHFGTLLFMSTSEWNCPAFQTNLRIFRLSFSRFFLDSFFFFSDDTDTGVLLQQTMKSHIRIVHSASPSSYKQTDLSDTIFLTAANQAGWMNCMHLACRWTSASNCRSQITFTADEKKKSTVAPTFVRTSLVYRARTTYLHMFVADICTTLWMAIKFWILSSHQGQLDLEHHTTPMEDSLQL